MAKKSSAAYKTRKTKNRKTPTVVIPQKDLAIQEAGGDVTVATEHTQKDLAMTPVTEYEKEERQASGSELSLVQGTAAIAVQKQKTGEKITTASSRMAERRQLARRRSMGSFMTAEEYIYVKRDLKIITILSVIMFSAIFVAYYFIGG